MKRISKGIIRGYQLLISPVLGQNCRFYPSCSAYALEAIDIHGTLKGFYLTAKRVGCCHPFHPGGVDPVPPASAGPTRQQADLETH